MIMMGKSIRHIWVNLQIKVSSIDEGFEFTNYICSLKIPVSIILREVSLYFIVLNLLSSLKIPVLACVRSFFQW